MSNKYKAEAVKAAESKIRNLEALRREWVGKLEAAQAAAARAAGEVDAATSNLERARAELEAAKVA